MPKTFKGKSACCGSRVVFKKGETHCFQCGEPTEGIPSKIMRLPNNQSVFRAARVNNVN